MKLHNFQISSAFLAFFYALLVSAAGCNGIKSENEKLKEEIIDVNAENEKLRTELNALKTENSNMHIRVAQLHLDIAALQREIQNIQRDLEMFKAQKRDGEKKNKKS